MEKILHRKIGDPHSQELNQLFAEVADWARRNIADCRAMFVLPFLIACRTDPFTRKILTIKPAGLGSDLEILARTLKNKTVGTEVIRLIDELARRYGDSAEAHLNATVAACLNRFAKPQKQRKR